MDSTTKTEGISNRPLDDYVWARALLCAPKRSLTERGHARHTVYSYLGSAAHLTHWAQRTDLSLARIDEAVIALRLGHESPNITHRYGEADLAIKGEALARLEQPATYLRRCRPPVALMAFLQQL
jgi:integrase